MKFSKFKKKSAVSDVQTLLDMYSSKITTMLNRGEYVTDIDDWITELSVDVLKNHQVFDTHLINQADLDAAFDSAFIDPRMPESRFTKGFKSFLENISKEGYVNVSQKAIPYTPKALTPAGHNKLDVTNSHVPFLLLQQ